MGLLCHKIVLFLVVLWNLHSVLCSGYINLYSHHQCNRVPFSQHPVLHLLFVDILMMLILTTVSLYFIGVLICITLTISDVEHLLKFFLTICMSLENCLKPLPVFIIIIFILHSINGVAESTLTLLTA